MKALGNLLFLGGLALCLSTVCAPADAAGKDGSGRPQPKPGSAPVARELQKSADRGLYSELPGSPGISAVISTPKSTPAVKPVAPAQTRAPAVKAKSGTGAAGSGHPVVKAAAKKAKPAQASSKPPANGIDTAEASDLVPVSHTTSAGELVLSAHLNRSGSPPRYKVGDKLEITVSSNADCNVVVFDYDGGTLTQIFPNDYQRENFLKGGDTLVIGGPESKFDYEIGGKGGQEKIFVYAYPTQSANPISIAFNPVPQTPFRAAPITLDQYRELVRQSKVFFAREVKVVPKAGVLASAPSGSAPNKLELSFVVEK
ncbi:MAG TPA: DUF4384 domain-containing protein [Candidatus Obscuribacterales bacterium]